MFIENLLLIENLNSGKLPTHPHDTKNGGKIQEKFPARFWKQLVSLDFCKVVFDTVQKLCINSFVVKVYWIYGSPVLGLKASENAIRQHNRHYCFNSWTASTMTCPVVSVLAIVITASLSNLNIPREMNNFSIGGVAV